MPSTRRKKKVSERELQLRAAQEALFPEDILLPCGEKILRPVRERAKDCHRCKLCLTRSQVVFGVGRAEHPLVAFVGEGPGFEEDRSGIPFVGRAGVLLNRVLEAAKLPRKECFITNLVSCRPPNNRTPEKDEIDACRPLWQAQLRAVQPYFVVALGNTAAQELIGTAKKIGDLRGIWGIWEGFSVLPTWHPAFILRLQGDEEVARKKEMWADIQQVILRLKKIGKLT